MVEIDHSGADLRGLDENGMAAKGDGVLLENRAPVTDIDSFVKGRGRLGFFKYITGKGGRHFPEGSPDRLNYMCVEIAAN